MVYVIMQNDAPIRNHYCTQYFRNSRQFRTPVVPLIRLCHTALDYQQNMFQIHHLADEMAVLFPQTNLRMEYNKLFQRKK